MVESTLSRGHAASVLVKTAMGALSSWWRRPEPQSQPADCLHREYSSRIDRKCQPHHPFAGKWLLLMLSIAVPHITCHCLSHCHEKDLCSPVNPFLRTSEQPLGKGFVHPSVLHFCAPSPCSLCRQATWVLVSLIPPSLYCSCLSAPSALLASFGRWPQQCAQAPGVSPQACSFPLPPPL